MNRGAATRLAGRERSASEEGRGPKGVRKQVQLPKAAAGAKPRARAEAPPDEEAATWPGPPARRSTPLAADLIGDLGADDDPVTVRADRAALFGLSGKPPAEGATDPATVLRSKIPVRPKAGSGKSSKIPIAFDSDSDADPVTVQRPRLSAALLGESIQDPETVSDQGDPGRWRDEIVPERPYETPPGPLPAAFHDTISRELPRAPLLDDPEEPHEPSIAVWMPLLAGAAGGVLILALVLAWLAGSP